LFTFREHVHYLDKWPWDLRTSTIASAIAWNSSSRELEGHQDDPAMRCIRYDTFVSELGSLLVK